ncbi:hypothetical protein KUTeg_007417 [Tegillarca granosa]|uniref:Temptin Cys/Cys disulfide domain-containing protein n=1 Tax=Tegillarca granosa TaxID=220873 RepID=A0ABQ9FH95_TEGGR|nr:hypothetical protein KUTeg_007417 [Tegillarca granosa]
MKTLIIFTSIVCVCFGHSYFRGFFPNGFKIPNPCAGASGKIWEGVGHTNAAGGGQLNPFGQDFSDNEYAWSKDMCLKDSDGDGKLNGVEIGDPNCEWFVGSDFELGVATGHPVYKRSAKMKCVAILVVTSFAVLCTGHPEYAALIPNGLLVPDPCAGTTDVWLGDFSAGGLKWTKDICEKDSDGDGKTNGEELGDQSCVWQQGQPVPAKPTGHPDYH